VGAALAAAAGGSCSAVHRRWGSVKGIAGGGLGSLERAVLTIGLLAVIAGIVMAPRRDIVDGVSYGGLVAWRA